MINCDGTSAQKHMRMSKIYLHCIESANTYTDKEDNNLSDKPITFITTKQQFVEGGKDIPMSSSIRKVSKGDLRRRNYKQRDKLHHCSHQKCMKNFKTRKQLISHHDRLELDCNNEKKLLVSLLKHFDNTIRQLDTIEFSTRQSKNYQSIIEQIDSAKSTVGNNDQFECLMDKLMKNDN